MEVVQGYKGLTIYTNNHVTEELVEATKNACEKDTWIHVSFDVIGRTKHVQLSYELAGKLGEEYEAVIDYTSYGCAIRRKMV